MKIIVIFLLLNFCINAFAQEVVEKECQGAISKKCCQNSLNLIKANSYNIEPKGGCP